LGGKDFFARIESMASGRVGEEAERFFIFPLYLNGSGERNERQKRED
jgi:hypothetical protein